MTTHLIVKFPILIAFCLVTLTASAQFDLSKVELGADVATFVYQGDLTPSRFGSFRTMRMGLGLYGNYKLSKIFSLKTNLLFGGLKGDESKYSSPAYRKQRNFKFTSPVTEISESLVWNILPPASEGGPRLSPYVSAGVGYAFLHVRRDYSNFNPTFFESEPSVVAGLSADTAHSLPRGIALFPVSAGLRYALTNNLSVNISTTYRLNSTDYLDGFSQSVNPAKKDHFFTNAIGVIYSFGKKNMLKCPKMKY
jgi:Outer membrane protein beta-barrel domain